MFVLQKTAKASSYNFLCPLKAAKKSWRLPIPGKRKAEDHLSNFNRDLSERRTSGSNLSIVEFAFEKLRAVDLAGMELRVMNRTIEESAIVEGRIVDDGVVDFDIPEGR